MVAIGKKQFYKNRSKIFTLFVVIFLFYEFFFHVQKWLFAKSSSEKNFYGENEQLQMYVNSKMRKFIQVASDHLRVNPAHDCECTRDSFIKLERDDILDNYHVYMV